MLKVHHFIRDKGVGFKNFQGKLTKDIYLHMASKISSLLILLSFFFTQCLQTTSGRMAREHSRQTRDEILETSLELSVFFHHNTLKAGTKLPLYFRPNDPLTSPRLLSREESDSIPFSTSQFPSILQILSFPRSSKQALAMWETLGHCESPPITGETKFCATSLESMLDSLRSIFGFRSKFRLITTSYLSGLRPSVLRNYTVIGPPAEILARRIVACHVLPYPYLVFYCHSQDGDNKLYRALLAEEGGGGRGEAAAMCHMETREWDSGHVAFRVLGMGPGDGPVCHFFPPDNLVWVSAS